VPQATIIADFGETGFLPAETRANSRLAILGAKNGGNAGEVAGEGRNFSGEENKGCSTGDR